MSAVIKVENLCKKYIITHEGKDRYIALRDVLANKAKKIGKTVLQPSALFKGVDSSKREEFWALKDVSFEVKKGERLGIIGRNGAGKSTLLKLLSRISEPTEGRITLRGRVGSLLEVGTGFHPELTGRENVYLNGAILGMSRHEINAKFDEIVQFAEVEKFLDTPVKRYSSGMQVRLAFAVAAHLEPEILLIDEVLAVGDTAFQKKCLGKMEKVSKDEGRTIIFISHNMAAVQELCPKGILLEKGVAIGNGAIADIISKYVSELDEKISNKWMFEENQALPIQFLETDILPSKEIDTETIILRIKYLVKSHADDVIMSVNVRNSKDIIVYYSNDLFYENAQKRKTGIHEIFLSIPTFLFGPGDYFIDYSFWKPEKVIHFPEERLFFNVSKRDTKIQGPGIKWPSVIYMPERWS